MAKMPRTPFTPAEVQARAVQLEHDQAALFLVRRAIQLEATAVRAGQAGSAISERSKMNQARAYRSAAARLVTENRPVSLGVPGWLSEGMVTTTTPSVVMNREAGGSVE